MPRCWPLLALVLFPACAPKAQEATAAAPGGTEHAALVGPGLFIAPGVDTSATADRAAIACLRDFCARKPREDISDLWYAPDLERYGALYSELMYAEYDSVGDPRYPPMVMRIEPVNGGADRLLEIVWAADHGTGHAPTPRYAFDLLVRSTENGARLSFPLSLNTREWERRTVGPVTYVISPHHVFNEVQAQEQQRVIDRLSAFFGVPVFPITYYSFADPVDLFRAKGFRHHPLQHIPSGGMVDEGDNVYSGNGKELYAHEIVHLFTRRAFGTRPGLLDEGLATLIGGSTERAYAWHRANLAAYLAADPALDLRGRCNTYVQDDINEHTSVPYTIGAVLCERLLRTQGKEGLFRAMAAGTDPWPALAGCGITPENLTDELRKELALPLFAAW